MQGIIPKKRRARDSPQDSMKMLLWNQILEIHRQHWNTTVFVVKYAAKGLREDQEGGGRTWKRRRRSLLSEHVFELVFLLVLQLFFSLESTTNQRRIRDAHEEPHEASLVSIFFLFLPKGLLLKWQHEEDLPTNPLSQQWLDDDDDSASGTSEGKSKASRVTGIKRILLFLFSHSLLYSLIHFYCWPLNIKRSEAVTRNCTQEEEPNEINGLFSKKSPQNWYKRGNVSKKSQMIAALCSLSTFSRICDI